MYKKSRLDQGKGYCNEQVRYQRNSEPLELLILVRDFNDDNKRINLYSSRAPE